MADGQFWEQTFSVNDAGREVQLPARGTGLSLTDEVGHSCCFFIFVVILGSILVLVFLVRIVVVAGSLRISDAKVFRMSGPFNAIWCSTSR